MLYDVDESYGSAQDFLDALLREPFRPTSAIDVVLTGANGYVFRGQAESDWPLRPSAHRAKPPWSNYTPQPPGTYEKGQTSPSRYLGVSLLAELKAADIFLNRADSLGIPTPIDFRSIRHHKELLDAAIGDDEGAVLQLVQQEFPHSSILPTLALAQHYGVPTRLLDWTESPLVAAFFAAREASSIVKSGQSAKPFAVYCLDTRLIYDLPNIELVSAPRHLNTFLRAQKGIFTLVRHANKYFLTNERWPSIEEVVQRERDLRWQYIHPPLIRLSLAASEADSLLRLLWQLDVTPHHLMPSLSSAANAFAIARALWPS